jgi:[protein-PII] uridylyltransferase
MRARSTRADEFVLHAWQTAVPPAHRDATALLAVGGYGRRELFPFSDVDLLIVEQPNTLAPGELSEFLRLLWDAGYRASHSVHTVADCRRISPGNVEFSISLLDRRPLAGPPDLLSSIEAACRHSPVELAQELAQMTDRRHERFQHTIQHLEPDIKETCGGLRDLNCIRWFCQLRGEAPVALESPAEALFAIRWALHEHAGRDQNTLRFAEQDALSPEPEAWMRDYFRHARTIFTQCRELKDRILENRPGLMRRFLEARSQLSNSEFTVSRDQILLRHPAAFEHDPESAFRLFLHQARHGLKLAPDTRRRIRNANLWQWSQWQQLLTLPHAAAALRSMAETGQLAHQLPEWQHIDCLVVRDHYHRYTVDEHTLIALSQLEGLAFDEHQFGGLWLNCESKPVLRFALLLHDIGKGLGGDHDQRAVAIAAGIGQRIGIPEVDLGLIQRLIAEHLYLSHLIHSRDLHDQDVITQAAHQMQTAEYLVMLTLLTIADSSAVFPGAMTTWRRTQLWHAYTLIERELTRELEDERIEPPAPSSDELADFISGLPTRYRFRTPPEEQRLHLALAKAAGQLGAGLDLRQRHGQWVLTVVTYDRPRLLADLAGVIASFGMNILKAEAFSNSRREVLDLFVFSDPNHSLELNPPIVEDFKEAVRRVISGQASADKLLERRRAPQLRHRLAIPLVLRFDNEASRHATLLELQTHDRPALLYDVTRTIAAHGCEIDTVLLHTEGQRAVDAFYLRHNHQKLSSDKIASLDRALRIILK